MPPILLPPFNNGLILIRRPISFDEKYEFVLVWEPLPLLLYKVKLLGVALAS